MQRTDTRPDAPHKDNILGICAALGRDFGFNPIVLRVALALTFLISPKIMLIAYGSAGIAVLASRLLVRDRKAPEAAARRASSTVVALPSADRREANVPALGRERIAA